MANLQFTQITSQDLYASEIVDNSNFNIHLDRVSGSEIRIYQKTGSET